MTVGRICRRPPCTIQARETARSAAQRMETERVGALVLVEDERPLGMLTDRDLVVRLVAEGQRAEAARVCDVASRPVAGLAEDLSLQAATLEMAEHGARRMPVVDDRGHLVGMLTADDLICLVATELTALADVASEQSPPERRTAPAPVLRESEHYARRPVTVVETQSAQDAARAMRDEGVGSVIVLDDSKRPKGLITDRDLVCRVVAPDLDAASTPVGQLVKRALLTLDASEPLQRVVATMSEHGIRRIPLTRDDELFGIVTYDDVVVALGGELQRLGEAVWLARRRELLGG